MLRVCSILTIAVVAGLLGACSSHPGATGSASPTTSSSMLQKLDAFTHPQSSSAATAPDASQPGAAAAANLAQPDWNTPTTAYVPVTSGNQLMFLYTGMSGLPPDWDTLAGHYSNDYAQTNDAFRKHDLMAALQPQMQAAVANAKAHPYIVWDAGDPQLSPYDFTRKGFPIGNNELDPSSQLYVSDNSDYHLAFTNGNQFQFMPVADETVAKQIEQMRAAGRWNDPIKLRVFAFAQSADPSTDTVKAVITEVQLIGPHGNTLYTQAAKH